MKGCGLLVGASRLGRSCLFAMEISWWLEDLVCMVLDWELEILSKERRQRVFPSNNALIFNALSA